MHEAKVPSPAPQKPGIVVYTCDPSTQEVQAGESQVQGYPQLVTSKAAWDTGTPPLKVGEGRGRREKKNKIEIQRLDVTYSGAHNLCQDWDGDPGMSNSKSQALDQRVIWLPTKAKRKWPR